MKICQTLAWVFLGLSLVLFSISFNPLYWEPILGTLPSKLLCSQWLGLALILCLCMVVIEAKRNAN